MQLSGLKIDDCDVEAQTNACIIINSYLHNYKFATALAIAKQVFNVVVDGIMRAIATVGPCR